MRTRTISDWIQFELIPVPSPCLKQEPARYFLVLSVPYSGLVSFDASTKFDFVSVVLSRPAKTKTCPQDNTNKITMKNSGNLQLWLWTLSPLLCVLSTVIYCCIPSVFQPQLPILGRKCRHLVEYRRNTFCRNTREPFRACPPDSSAKIRIIPPCCAPPCYSFSIGNHVILTFPSSLIYFLHGKKTTRSLVETF